ncbi:hypothetical protein ACJJI3_10010 [Microbulbifer sp. ZKSA004]|uniref:hypothetical protein n=1 Tax=Microbulbifer sp. ZKSA004 TaxID=3243389 RepID=UPI0040398E9F
MISSFIDSSFSQKVLEPDFLDSCKASYQDKGFFNVPDIVNADLFNDHIYQFYKSIKSILVNKTIRKHDEFTFKDVEMISNAGFSFYRLLMKSRCIPKEHQDTYIDICREFQLVELANLLNKFTGPLLNYCTDKAMKLVDVKCFIYEEGDYIGVHNDRHVEHHINFQFPVNINTIGTFRYMNDGNLKLNYDQDGGAKAMCGDIWHDVPPIIRSGEGEDPVRIVYMLVYR